MKYSKILKHIEILDEYGDLESFIRVEVATSPEAHNLIAIHLLSPDEHALDDAIEIAWRDGFERIVIHNLLTWPQAKGVLS